MAGFGRTLLTYARPYRAQALLVFLTEIPSVAFVTAQLRTVFERIADARQRELAALR